MEMLNKLNIYTQCKKKKKKYSLLRFKSYFRELNTLCPSVPIPQPLSMHSTDSANRPWLVQKLSQCPPDPKTFGHCAL